MRDNKFVGCDAEVWRVVPCRRNSSDGAADVTVSTSFCRVCLAACALLVETDGDDIVSVRGDPDNPTTRGYTCSKGRALAADHRGPGRLNHPMMRRDGELVPTEWDEVLSDLTGRLASIIEESGPDAVAVYFGSSSSFDINGRRAAETLARRIGTQSIYTTVTIDCPSKPLVAHAMLGHPRLMPLGDLANTGLALIIGANPIVSHGHTWAFSDPVRVVREVAARAPVWVIDPRRSETARLASGHLSPRPATDHIVLAHLVREVLHEGADSEYVRRFTEGVDDLAAAVAPFDLAATVRITGLVAADLERLVGDIRSAGRIAIMTGTGVTMGPTANAVEWMAMALAAVTGSIDRAGGLWFNPGYLSRIDLRGLGPPSEPIAEPGPRSRPDLFRRNGQYPVAALTDEIESGHVRALVCVGGNLVASGPAPERFAAAAARLDVLAVAELSDSAQVRLATHVLACSGQLERADTTWRQEIFLPEVVGQYTAPVVAPYAQRRPMWWAFAKIGRGLGVDVFPGVDLATAVDDDILDATTDRARLALLRSHPHGASDLDAPRCGWVVGDGGAIDRILLAPIELIDSLELNPPASSLVLAPRRQFRHVNSQFLPVGQPDSAHIWMNPQDAAESGLRADQRVKVTSPYGTIVGSLLIDDGLAPGYMSIPQGYSGDEPNVNSLVSSAHAVDRLTGMPLQAGLALQVSAC